MPPPSRVSPLRLRKDDEMEGTREGRVVLRVTCYVLRVVCCVLRGGGEERRVHQCGWRSSRHSRVSLLLLSPVSHHSLPHPPIPSLTHSLTRVIAPRSLAYSAPFALESTRDTQARRSSCERGHTGWYFRSSPLFSPLLFVFCEKQKVRAGPSAGPPAAIPESIWADFCFFIFGFIFGFLGHLFRQLFPLCFVRAGKRSV